MLVIERNGESRSPSASQFANSISYSNVNAAGRNSRRTHQNWTGPARPKRSHGTFRGQL